MYVIHTIYSSGMSPGILILFRRLSCLKRGYLRERSLQLATVASTQAKGLQEAWPTYNHGIDHATFWRTKQTCWGTRPWGQEMDCILPSPAILMPHLIIGMFSMPATRRHSVSNKWQWPRGWVEMGDSCPFANEQRSSDSFNNTGWYRRRSSCRYKVAIPPLVV